VLTPTVLVLQYVLARRQYRLALYDKRFPVFDKTLEYITAVHKKGITTYELTSEFKRNVVDKKFLFKKDVQDFVQQLYDNGVKLWSTAEVLKSVGPLPSGLAEESRVGFIMEVGELKNWFITQESVAKKLFEPYLRVSRFR
jgi:hypothetical protein